MYLNRIYIIIILLLLSSERITTCKRGKCVHFTSHSALAFRLQVREVHATLNSKSLQVEFCTVNDLIDAHSQINASHLINVPLEV